MDVVRGVGDPLPPEEQSRYYSMEQVKSSGHLLQQRQKHLDYTAKWVNRVELPERAHSTCPVNTREPGMRKNLPGVAQSAPALSIR